MTEMSGHRTSFGKYTLHERIGRGGFADIFKATLAGAPAGSGTLAIKRMFPHLAEDTLFASMFIQEAKLSSLLAHPCIVRIEEFGAVDGVLYIAMEHVEGRDLSQALHRLGRLGLGMPPALAAFIVSRVAGALHYAHRRRDLGARPLNIIHRDVTPQNVLLSWQGEVKLADFGIAKATTSQIRTRTGALKGKYPYMAPEQLEDHCDHRSDLYSAGVILWELIAGRRLFTGETDWQVLQQVAGGEIPPITDLAPVSAGLAAIISRALATDPGARFQSGEEMAQALLRAAACPKQLTGAEALAGFLAGATLCGVTMGLMMSNGGGAWDNAKKWIEEGNLGGKGSDAHKAAVVGDTVGDPFKDTSGPSMNILIKLMSVVSLVLAPLVVYVFIWIYQ